MKLIVSMFMALLFIGPAWSEELTTHLAREPLHTARFDVGQKIVPDFISRLRGLSERHHFAILVSEIRPNGKNYIVQMWRYDVNLIAINPLPDATKFSMAIYRTCPHDPIAEDAVSTVWDSFNKELGSLSGVTIIEPK